MRSSAYAIVLVVVTLFVLGTSDVDVESVELDMIDEDLCDDVDCPLGQHCEMTLETGPICVSCVVHERCSNELSLVCGSDDKTYMNDCHMRRVACENGKKLTVKSKGACGALPYDPCLGILCAPNYKCRMVKKDDSEAILTPKCVCSDTKDKCVEEQGKSCGDHTCESYEECVISTRDLHVCCIMNCSSPAAIQQFHRPVPVCGVNKVVYSSLCLLDKIRCLTSKSVEVETFMSACTSHASPHKCGSIDKFCSEFELCARHETGFSCCPSSCPTLQRKECGSDGHIYMNFCHRLRHACMTGQEIKKRDMKYCSKSCKLNHKTNEATSGSKFTLSKDGCTECICDNGEWQCDESPCLRKFIPELI